ncbi:MAG TPA: hypothetical protein VNG90_03295 [Candidatus Acidoferrum sp.]|nr:hypothetical protein [Candidatus Acidoferrum sp.]
MTQPNQSARSFEPQELLPFAIVEDEFRFTISLWPTIPKRYNPTDRVEAYLTTPDGKILLYKPKEQDYFVFPGGFVGPACKKLDSRMQELLEQLTGIWLPLSVLQYAGSYTTDGSNRTHVILASRFGDLFTGLSLGVYAEMDFFMLGEDLPLVGAHSELCAEFLRRQRSVEAFLRDEEEE